MKYTKRQERLLRVIGKADKWYIRRPFGYVIYLLPLLFLGGQWWFWRKVSESTHWFLATRIGDNIMPLDISPDFIFCWMILPITFMILIGTWLVDSMWEERRTFKTILETKEEEDKS